MNEHWKIVLPKQRSKLRCHGVTKWQTVSACPGAALESLLLQPSEAVKSVVDNRYKEALYNIIFGTESLDATTERKTSYERKIGLYLASTYGLWAGKHIVCIGSNANSHPPSLKHQYGSQPLRPYFAQDPPDIRFWQGIIIAQGCTTLLEPLQKAFDTWVTACIPNDREWVLIDMDNKQYVYAQTLETGLGMFSNSGDHWGLGEAAIGLIRWSDKPPLSHEKPSPLGGIHGHWAGHRLAIIRKEELERYADAKEWCDISDLALHILRSIRHKAGTGKHHKGDQNDGDDEREEDSADNEDDVDDEDNEGEEDDTSEEENDEGDEDEQADEGDEDEENNGAKDGADGEDGEEDRLIVANPLMSTQRTTPDTNSNHVQDTFVDTLKRRITGSQGLASKKAKLRVYIDC